MRQYRNAVGYITLLSVYVAYYSAFYFFSNIRFVHYTKLSAIISLHIYMLKNKYKPQILE